MPGSQRGLRLRRSLVHGRSSHYIFPLLRSCRMYTVTERTQFTATAAWLYSQLFFIKELTSICLFKVGSLILLKTSVMPPLSAHYQMSLECFILLLALGTNAVIPGASRFCYLTA